MVNTFLLDKDFRVSASKLDTTRLGKQRVEAYQILITLYHLRFLARFFNIPDFPVNIDRPKEERKLWIRSVLNTFKQSGLLSIHIRENIIILYRHGENIPRKPESGNKLFNDPKTGLIYEVKGKRQRIVSSGHWTNYVLPGEELISTTIRPKPAIEMWLGFEEALKDYINAHIEVWIKRGGMNTMKFYKVNPDYPRPIWSYSDEVINNFKSTLINREIDRFEMAWYLKQPDFIDSWVTSEKNGKILRQFVSELPNDAWFKYAQIPYIKSLGYFPGFIWP